MCENYDYLGSRRDGGFAEYVAVPEWNLIELPDAVSDEAAAMLEPLAVAVHGVRAMDIRSGEKCMVCGLGTIGMFYAMVLMAYGADVYVVGKREGQKKRALEVGIEESHYYDYSEEREPRGMDVFFECVGTESSLVYGLDALRPGGRMLLVGNPQGEMSLPRNDYWKILRHQLTVRGTWNSSYTRSGDDDWHEAIRLIECGEVRPETLITQRYALEELERGLLMMRDKTDDYCKVMVTS
jgi:L-iditol 2-dehydrogenase